ncbi:2TM domain-containing protein [Lutimonas zeaxanthinifaciens]|uniref:2TM domain-containing protein n=1 Tax=Lutimonas zeaxanthinifaciens TaxID=3060215 RepID=UPI00265D3629|nr:2TM domain-containing protein [Lutimonas sp. YSD2104]WKK67232.1 2TM domain-containing protein [Lutimonas sp. YSD2104]
MENNYTEEERYRRAQKRVKEIKGFYWHLFWYLAVNIFLTFGGTIRSLFVDGSMDFGNLNIGNFSVWFFWGIGIVGHWLHVFGMNIFFSRNWEERKIKEYMDKDKFD